jgi:hypothetical protein
MAPTLQGERIETPAYIKEKGLKPDYMFYIDHQISNPICQLFGVVVEQIPGFESYLPPKGGWQHSMPEALTIQRETAAYHLLFDEAISSNTKGSKRAFAKLLGASVKTENSTVKSAATTKSPQIHQTRSQTKQSTLDSLFMTTVKLQATKEASNAIKETSKK